MMSTSQLIVSIDVPNDPIPWSEGTNLVDGQTYIIDTDIRKAAQVVFLGYILKMEEHLDWCHNFSFLPITCSYFLYVCTKYLAPRSILVRLNLMNMEGPSIKHNLSF